jgi:TRAP-type C4-dicarboxylate transport system permease small subunit
MTLSKAVEGLAKALALLGGLALIAITLITVISITGRAFIWAGLRPVPGDFELVEAGVGFAIFAFLPWCQITRSHATVDIMTAFFSDRLNRIINLISEILLTGIIILIAWRLWEGMQDKIRFRETTFILQFPVWWPYAACMVAAGIAVIVSIYMVWVRIGEVRTGAPVDEGQGAVH